MIPHFENALRLFEVAQDQAGIADAMFNIAQYRLEVDCNNADTWQMMRRSIQLADDAGDANTANLARVTLANWTHFVMRLDEAEAMLREHVLRCEAQHDLSNLSKSLWCLGHLLAERMLLNESAAYFLASGQIAEQIQNPYDQMHGYTCAAEIIRVSGNLSLSLEMLETQLAFARSHLPNVDQVFPTMLLAKALNEAGERDRAMALLIDCLKFYDLEHISKTIDFSHLFDNFGCVHSNNGNAMQAALMFGFADACIVNGRYRRWAHSVWELAPFIARARAALGDEAYDAAHAKGFALTIKQAIEYTLDQT